MAKAAIAKVPLDPRAVRILRARRRARFILLALGLMAIAALLASQVSQGGAGSTDHDRYHQRRFRVIDVPEGDLIRVDAGESAPLAVRLIGVDANGSPAARQQLERLCGREVLIYLELVPTRNHAGELLAYVYAADGLLVNQRMIESAQAFADRRWEYSFLRTFLQAEEQVRSRGVGIWADLPEERMPEWRRRWLAEMRKEPWLRGEWRRPDEP